HYNTKIHIAQGASGDYKVTLYPLGGTVSDRYTNYYQERFTFTIRVVQRIYTMKCAGADVITFDAGANDTPSPTTIVGFQNGIKNSLHGKGIITINNFLIFSGDLVIDTTTNTMTSTGSWYVENI